MPKNVGIQIKTILHTVSKFQSDRTRFHGGELNVNFSAKVKWKKQKQEKRIEHPE